MDKAKEWLTTLTAHLPEWCAEWIPDVDQWQWQQWHPADLWQWARTREWRVPELPRWGEDGTLVPEWIFPSYWRKRVREAVLWVWLIFITFLAAREEQTQREVEGSQLENDSGAAAHADDQRQKVPSVPEEGEEEEDDEETGAWRGGLERPGGLTRYPGIENLLAQPPTATPPPPRHRPPPPVTATQVSNKQILLKPDETQSRKNESREGGSEEPGEKNHQDEVWKTLLAKYGTEECVRETDKAAEEDDEEEVPEYVGTAEEIVERYSAKFEEPRQDMSPEEEFSAKVGRRLEEYLQRLDEDDEESSQAKEVEQKTKEVEQTEKEVEETGDAAETEEARDIEDGGERLEGITSNGNENRIFIVIEDEESEDDRRNLNDISEGSEISQALETQDAELKDEGQLEEEIKELSSQQNGLSCEAEPQEEAVMETVPEASGKVDDREEIVEHAADTVQPETPHDAAEGMKAELKDDTINMTEEQLSDATLEEKGKETKEEYTKEVVEKTPETATTYVAEDQTEESIKLSSGEEVKLEEDAEITSIEPPKEQDEMAEQESTKQTSPQPPEEVKQEEVQTLAAAEEGSERHDNVSEDVIMKEQDSIESEALATRHETQEETTEEDKVVEEEEEEKYKQIKEDETIKDEGKETLEIKVATDVSVEENKVVEEQETANKDAREDEKVLETEVFVKLPEDVKKEAVEEEKKHQVEAGVTEDEERELPTDKAAEVAATEPPAAVEEIQVDEETHFEDGKAEESKDEAMVVEEHMEDEEVPVASVEGWTQDVWGTLGQAPGEAAPLVPPASIDMMEEDTEDVMEVDVEEEVGETMEEDLEVFVDDVDLRELPESPVPLPTVPEEEDHLAEVQDLLVRPPPRKHRRRHRQEEEHADTKGMSEAAAVADPSLAKYMTMPPALSPEEEEELRKYLAESGDAKDLSVDKFMSMPTELTEQEQKELEEAVRERERVRQAESAGLDRFLNMPVGLTEQEIHELKDLEREKEEAAVQPWERGDVGFEDYLSMPHTLTEEEERMLQEGEEDEEERQFASEEEYREYVKNKFLSQLEEDALRMAEEDYDYDEDYDDDYEYEDDEEYEDEEEVEDEDEGEMEGEYVMVSDLAAASNLPQAAAASTATVPAATAPAAATATPAKMVDEAVNTELNDPKEDAKSKKKPFPFPKKSDRETTPEDSNSAAQKKFFHFGSLGTKRKKETPDFLDKKYLGNPNGRKFDGGGGGGSLSAAFCTVGDQVTRAVLQKVKGQIRQGKATKEVGLRKDFAGVSESGGVGSPKTSRGFTRLYLKPDQSDSGAGDEETPLSNPAEHLNSKNELEHVFAKIIKSYKSPNYQTTQGSKPNHSDNVTKSEMNEAKRTLDATEQTQEEDATRVFIKDAEKDLMSSPILDIIMEEEEEEMDAEVALVFTHEREVAKAGGDEEDFWLRWSNEERACVSAARDCCSPWQLAEGADTDREDNEEAVRWSEEKEGSSQTGVKVTVNNEENDKTNRNEEEKDEEVMGRKYKQETIREKKAEETQRGSAMANVETTDAAVSNAQLEADSLEFGVNTNLSVMDDSASPKGASPSLQELIEAELNVRLCQPDSLEPPSPDPSSLLSCDSIEPTPPTLIPALTPAKAPTTATPTGLTLDSLLDLDSLQDPVGMADTESGIDVLSPTKLDDLSTLDMDSLESSSDLPGSSHCSPEPTVTLTTRVSTVEEKGTHLTIAEAGDPLLPSKKCASSLEAEGVLLALREDDSDAASLGDLQVAPPLLRISESSLTIASETRSELSQVSQEVTRSSTPDSLTSFEGGSAPQDSTALQDNDVPQEITQDSDVLESLLLQNSVVPDSDSMQGTVEVQEIVTLSHTVDTQHDEESSSLLDSVSPSDRKVSQEDRVDLLPSVPQQEVIVTQDSASPLEASLQQDKHTEAVAPGDLAPEETNFLTSPESSETPAEPSHLLPAHDPASPSSPQSQDRSSPSPSPAGALPLNGTNSVCDGDLSNSARDDCGDVGVSSGRVDTTTQAVSSSDGGGGGVGVSGPVTSLQNGSNMESQVEDEDDFWGSKNDDDDIFVPRHRFDPVQCDQEENDTEAKEEQKAEQMEQEEEEEEEEGNNFFGSDDDDKGAKGLRFKKRTTTTTRTENGIGGIEKKKEVVEQVEKKKQIEESGGKKIEVTTEKKKVEVREERKKADIKEEKKKEVEEEKKKEAIEEEDKENGVAEDGGEKKKKKKKHRDSEDGERLRKKKKKKRDSEKENKEASSSSSANELDSEEEHLAAPTPPLFNGHAIIRHPENGCNGEQVKDENLNDREPLIIHETNIKEGFHSLLHAYKENTRSAKETPEPAPLSDGEDLAGVSVKQLRSSYLSVAQDTKRATPDILKTPVKPEIKAELNTSVNISSLVDTYSTSHPRPVTPSSRPDDITPVSLRSLKSAYEATASGSSCAVSRHSSSGSCSPAGGSPAPKEELNVSLQQLREEYCRSVQDGLSRSHTPSKQPLDTGVSIRQLTRSMNDLRGVGRDSPCSIIECDRPALASVNVKALTRSFSDLTRLNSEPLGPTTPTTPRHLSPTHSVNVKKLRASYGDLHRLTSGESGGLWEYGGVSPSLPHSHAMQVSQVSSECRQCGKQVFQMEKIVAEKAAWHKNCFRCKECNCILTLETYQSHEGVLYCKPHFKELFRPKVVVEDPDEARKERSTNKPDYGLEDLSHANLKQKFKMFEQISTEEERVPDPIPVRRSQSLLTKAARFMQSDDDYGIENSELGEYDEDEEDEDYEEDEEEDGEEGEEGEDGKLNKKSRAASFSGMKDLKAGFARKNRQDELTKKRRQELAKFRQMLCAGKNISTREIFEGGNEDEKGQLRRKEQIKIEGQIDAKNLRERFEKGLSVVESDSEESGDRREVDRVFKEAETASKARNLFKQIDKTVAEGGEVVLRPASSAQARRENRLSRDGIDMEELELGRDPNLVKCTDNYEDEVDCRGTRKLLAKFKKMEKQAEIIDKEGEEDYDSDEEYSDEEYSDEEEEDSEEEDSEEEDSEEEDGKPKYKDEVLEMVKSSQSAKKAASLRAKFEKWESEVERNNEYNQSIERYEDEDECMPSIDTARNLRAMFENKAQESTQPVGQRPKVKVNRFVGGGGDKCMLCDHTVYAMERLEVAGRVLHKNCFKCCKCSTKLSMNTFSIGGDDMYCTTHYKQAFTEKGTYDVFTPNKGSPVKAP
ncbi:hypothetical protein O3P69_020870 [Scylla paramamosain]|uniref:LIM zinc-binding domain-containing protein n=1 Tax=Scylla paramamosain TaxID=85552 RepID=A0AAW0TP37_SCYPA